MQKQTTNKLDSFYNDILVKINSKNFNPNELIYYESQNDQNKYLTPMQYAMKSSYYDCLEYKKENSEDIDKYTAFGEKSTTMLFKVIQLLIDEGNDVNLKNKEGHTSLMEGISLNSQMKEGYKNSLIIEESKGDIKTLLSIKDKFSKWGPLSENGYIDIITLIINNGANLNTKDKKGKTALIYALEHTDIEVLNLLVKNNVDTNLKKHDTREAFRIAFARESLDVIKFLMNNGGEINNKILNDAIKTNNVEIVKLFMTTDVDLSHVMFKPLRIRKLRNEQNIDIKVLELLINNGLKINLDLFNTIADTQQIAKLVINKTKDKELLHEYYAIAQSQNNIDVLKLLEEMGINFGKTTAKVKVLNFTRNMPERLAGNILWFIFKYNLVELFIPIGLILLKLYMKFKMKSSVKDIESIKVFNNKKIKIKLKKKITEAYLKVRFFKFNLIKLIQSRIDTQIIKIILENKDSNIDVNKKDEKGRTALMLACKTKELSLVKLLVKHKADIEATDDNGNTVLNYSLGNKSISIFLLAEKQRNNTHNPQKLTRLLTNFRKDTPIKYTTHIWDINFKDDYGDFKTYLLRVADQWNEIEEQLKELSPRLHSKIYTFLLNTNIDARGWCSKNGDDINMGWSSIKGLEEWCNAGNDPFNFLLEKPYKVENKTITTFGNVITLFKQEIQIRNENNMLLNIFTDIEEQLDEEFDGIFEFELINLKGKTFYIDTEIFKNILVDRIFKDMVKPERHKFKNIKIEIGQNTSLNYHELRIIQIGSQSNQSSHDMLNHHGADTSIIKEELANLCDWSIESSSATDNYRINYLKSDATLDDIEPLDYTPEGYTHIMRFYK